jgi:Domain of unknown function (DUF6894)
VGCVINEHCLGAAVLHAERLSRERTFQYPSAEKTEPGDATLLFHIKDKAKTTLDTHGVDLDSLDEVREEATESARQLIV